MQRILIWLLIFQFATGHNLLAELARMPLLLDHYKIHQQDTPNLTLSQFLWLHYANLQHENSDSRHEKLPMHCASGIMAESIIPQAPELEFAADVATISTHESVVVSDEFLRLSAPLDAVFRPPIA